MTEVLYKIPAIARKSNGARNPRGKVQYTSAKGQRFDVNIGGRLVSFVLQYGWNGETGAYDVVGEWSRITHLSTGWKVSEFKIAYLMYCVNSGDLQADPLKFASKLISELVERVGAETMLAKFDSAAVINS